MTHSSPLAQRVVAAMGHRNPQVAGRGLYLLQQAGIEGQPRLDQLVKPSKSNKGFLKRMRTGFPYIQSKLAHRDAAWPWRAAAKASGSLRLRRGATYNDSARTVTAI
ncbi:hypothetical protein ACNKHX_02105 [Shigella flexneri]